MRTLKAGTSPYNERIEPTAPAVTAFAYAKSAPVPNGHPPGAALPRSPLRAVLAVHPHVMRTRRQANKTFNLRYSMKIIWIGSLLVGVTLLIGVFFLATIDETSGGSDSPISSAVAAQFCQMGFPDYSDSITCYWWTGGTQDWEHQARFRIPTDRISRYIDSTTEKKGFNSLVIATFEENNGKIAKSFKAGSDWWDLKDKAVGAYLRTERVDLPGTQVWIDTVNGWVYFQSEQ